MSANQTITVIAALYIGAMLTIASGVLLYAGLGPMLITIGCFLMIAVLISYTVLVA